MTVPKTIRIGDKGPAVSMLQLGLNRAGFYFDRLDGIFGNNTRKAVISFQKANNLFQDGIAGNMTWSRIIPYLRGYLVHHIIKGDTLYKISEKHGTTVKRIVTANPNIDPLNLLIGESLIVPLNYPVISSEIPITSALYEYYIDGLKKRYPFISSENAGKSVMGKPLIALKIGSGRRSVFYNASHHANEWLTTLILLRFLEDYAQAYAASGSIGKASATELFKAATIHMIPLVNPDGVDLVTGYLHSGYYYNNAVRISKTYSDISFPNGWKANIMGTDLNLQYPAGWENAKEIKFSQGFTSPAPRDYVGKAPLSAPESKSVYDYTRKSNFDLSLSYHTQGEVIYWKYLNYVPKCAEEYGKVFSLDSGYALDDVPHESGYAGYKDFFIYEYMRPGYTIEAGKGTSPLPLSVLDSIYGDNIGILVSAAEEVCASTD